MGDGSTVSHFLFWPSDGLHCCSTDDTRRMRQIRIAIRNRDIGVLYPLLQKGLPVHTEVGRDLERFLCELLSVSPSYIDDRIKTILLDGKPADHLSSALVRTGSVVALSSAMPGLAGTTLRRGGHLSAFRDGITHRSDATDPIRGIGTIVVKFFNLLIRELGAPLLNRGVPMVVQDIGRVLRDLGPDLTDPRSVAKACVDGMSVEMSALLAGEALADCAENEPCMLQIGAGDLELTE